MCIQRHLTWPPCTCLYPFAAYCAIIIPSGTDNLFVVWVVSYDCPLLPFCKPRREASGEIKPDNTLILNFQPAQLWEHKFLLCKPHGLCCFVMAAHANYFRRMKLRHTGSVRGCWLPTRTSIHPSCLVTENWIRDWYLASQPRTFLATFVSLWVSQDQGPHNEVEEFSVLIEYSLERKVT